MRVVIILIFLTFITQASIGQGFELKCNNINIWSSDEKDFSKKFNKLFNEGKKHDSVVAYIYQGGIGWKTHLAFVCYKEKNEFKFHLFKREKTSLQLKEVTVTETEKEIIKSFFAEKMYLTTDSIPTGYLNIDDGSSDQIVYKVGSYCATVNFMPYFFNNELNIWSQKIKNIILR